MPPQSRALLGAILIIVAAGMTVLRGRAATEPRATLDAVRRLQSQGGASSGALANAESHAAHARRSLESRWHLTGYATQGLLGSALGLGLVVFRRRRGAG